ncbi:biotin--[acetyl-CoA-carboxylase] ligase [Brachybacterium sp. DNPG3]
MTSTLDLADELLHAGEPLPFGVLAAEQTAGRGRLGRRFESPAAGSLAFTLAHRTPLPVAARTWFPIAVGVAALAAIGEIVPGARAGLGLKWPNDLHTADGRKLGGILVEGRGADVVLLGIGVNLTGPVLDGEGAPVPGTAWLLGPGGEGGAGHGSDVPAPEEVDGLRSQLAERIGRLLEDELEALASADGDGTATGLHERYTMTCITLGAEVRVDVLGAPADGPSVHGTAESIDGSGRLLVRREDGALVPVDVGDVRHLRPVRGEGGRMGGSRE